MRMPDKKSIDVDNISKSRLRELSDLVSRRLMTIAIMLLIIIFLSQCALQNDYIRGWITGVDRWEGTAIH